MFTCMKARSRKSPEREVWEAAPHTSEECSAVWEEEKSAILATSSTKAMLDGTSAPWLRGSQSTNAGCDVGAVEVPMVPRGPMVSRGPRVSMVGVF